MADGIWANQKWRSSERPASHFRAVDPYDIRAFLLSGVFPMPPNTFYKSYISTFPGWDMISGDHFCHSPSINLSRSSSFQRFIGRSSFYC